MTARTIQCPTCRRPIDWARAEFRPFCSERCRLIDLGAWLDGAHAIPGPPAEAAPEFAAGEPGREDHEP